MSGGTAFAVPSFRRLWAAGLISDAGDWLMFIAMPLVVYRISGSALGTSLAFLLELAPAVALSPLAARLVNRFDRRTLMVVVNIGQAAVLLPLLFVHTRADLPIAYLVIAAQASLSTVFEPAKNALLPDLVGPDRLVSANALVGLNQNLGRLVGGPLGGVLLAVGDLGFVVAVDIVSYALSAILIATVPRVPVLQGVASEDADGGGLLAAFRIPRLRGTYAVIFVSSIAQGLFLVLFVLFVLGPMRGSDADVGVLRGIQAVGAIAAGLGLGLLARSARPRTLTVLSLLLFGALSLVTWNLPMVTTNVVPYLVLFALVGAPGVVLSIGLITSLQQESTPGQRGGVFAALGMLMAIGQAIGILAAGLVDGPVGLLPLLEVQGVLYLVSGIIALFWMPRHVPAVATPV